VSLASRPSASPPASLPPTAPSKGIVLKDSTGVELELEGAPERVVSLAPSLTRQIIELGAKDVLVGVTTFCDVGENSEINRIGTLVQPSVEKVAAVEPDLVLATKEGNRPEIGAKLRSVGLPLFVFKERTSFDDMCAEFELIGEVLGRKRDAKARVAEARKRLDKVEERLKGKPRVKVFLAYGTDPIIGAAKGTFGDEIVTRSGGTNVSHDSRVRYPKYGKERLAREDPDVVLLAAMGSELERSMKRWKEMSWLRAVRTGGVHAVPPDPMCSPTPTTYCDAVETVAEILHPRSKGDR
jgi:iron complex transport system substrate-binding protein